MKKACTRVKLSTTNAKFSFLEDNKRLSATTRKIHQRRHILWLGGLKVLTSGAFSLILKTKFLAQHQIKNSQNFYQLHIFISILKMIAS